MATNNQRIIHDNLFSILIHEDETVVSVSVDDGQLDVPSETYKYDNDNDNDDENCQYQATVIIPATNLTLSRPVETVSYATTTREGVLERMFEIFNNEILRVLLSTNVDFKHFFLQTLFDFMAITDVTDGLLSSKPRPKYRSSHLVVPISAFYSYGLCRPSEHVLMRWMHAYCSGKHQVASSYYHDPDGVVNIRVQDDSEREKEICGYVSELLTRDTVLLFDYTSVFETLMEELPTDAMRVTLRDILDTMLPDRPLLVFVNAYDGKTNTVEIESLATQRCHSDQQSFASTIFYKLRDLIATFQTIHIHAIRDMSTCLWEVPCWTSVAAHQLIHKHHYRFVNQLPRALSEFYYGNDNAPSYRDCHIHYDRNQKIDTRRCDWEIKKFTRLFSSFAALNPSIKKRRQIILRQLYDIFIHLFSLPHITNADSDMLKLAFFRHALLAFEYEVMCDRIPDWVQLPYDAEFPSLSAKPAIN